MIEFKEKKEERLRESSGICFSGRGSSHSHISVADTKRKKILSFKPHRSKTGAKLKFDDN